jgi:hypothetical protein
VDLKKQKKNKQNFLKNKSKKTCVLFGHGRQLLAPKVGVNGREEPKLFTTNKAEYELGCTRVHG